MRRSDRGTDCPHLVGGVVGGFCVLGAEVGSLCRPDPTQTRPCGGGGSGSSDESPSSSGLLRALFALQSFESRVKSACGSTTCLVGCVVSRQTFFFRKFPRIY
jgi:hypothetical protein